MALMSKYLSPSMKLSKYYQSWLEKKSADRAVATFVKLTTANLKPERYTGAADDDDDDDDDDDND